MSWQHASVSQRWVCLDSWEYNPRSSLNTHAFHLTDSTDPDVHALDCWMPATKTHPACTIHKDGTWFCVCCCCFHPSTFFLSRSKGQREWERLRCFNSRLHFSWLWRERERQTKRERERRKETEREKERRKERQKERGREESLRERKREGKRERRKETEREREREREREGKRAWEREKERRKETEREREERETARERETEMFLQSSFFSLPRREKGRKRLGDKLGERERGGLGRSGWNECKGTVFAFKLHTHRAGDVKDDALL